MCSALSGWRTRQSKRAERILVEAIKVKEKSYLVLCEPPSVKFDDLELYERASRK
jgi:hypothetical protein